jgi:hypothetical protein
LRELPLNNTLYVLVVDKAWAKLYKAAYPPEQLSLVYHQALFGGRLPGAAADAEVARSLCRLLRADRQLGKFQQLVMLASEGMLSALRREYDGEWHDVTVGRVEELAGRFTHDDIAAHLRRLLVPQLHG